MSEPYISRESNETVETTESFQEDYLKFASQVLEQNQNAQSRRINSMFYFSNVYHSATEKQNIQVI